MSRIFLSHSSRDMRAAVALKRWLEDQNPALANEIFLDVDAESGLQTGIRWKDALRQANARCEAVVCLLSKNWEASHECKVEYRTAENLNKQIFVARLEPSTGDDLTSEWQRCDLFGDGPQTAVDIGGGPPVRFATEGLRRLRDGIRGAGIGADSFVWPPPNDPDRAPYRGWEPLEESDAAVFFGRDAQIVRALDTLRGMRTSEVGTLFAVLGPSGTGKSSFLRAGLLPRLRREDRRFVVMDIVRPERNVLSGQDGLAASICGSRRAFGLGTPALGELKNLCAAADLDRIAELLLELRHTAAARVLHDDAASAAPTLVLPLDQAEELFSADAGEPAEVFLRILAGLIERLNVNDCGLIVAATIRTDRYEVMQTHPALAGVGSVLFDELKPMPPTQFQQVIVGPAKRATEGGHPLRVAPDLVEQLLVDARKGADTLPMLALTLARLYGDYGSTGVLTLEQYQSLGGIRSVVQTEIDDVLSSDPGRRAGELEALRAAFIPWLATVNPDNDQPMRRVARLSDLPADSHPLIDALVAKRLMVKDTRDGQTVVEVALESLLRQWDELAGWLREERKTLADADDLERAALAWQTNDRDPAWLLEGSRLAVANELVDKPGFQQRLSGIAGYLDASREREAQRRDAEEQRRQDELRMARERQQTAEAHAATLRKRSRVLRAVLALTAVIAVVAAGGFVWANRASNEANRQLRQAVSQRLLTDGQAMLDGAEAGGDVQALQRITAANALAAEQDRDQLYNAAVKTAGVRKLIQAPTEVTSLGVSADGRIIATGGSDGQIHLWDSDTGQPHRDPLSGHDGAVSGVQFGPDGTTLVSSGADGTMRWWNLESGQTDGEPMRSPGHGAAQLVAINGKGDVVLGRDESGGLWFWKLDDRKPQSLFDGGVQRAAVSGRSQRVATARGDTVRLFDMGDSGAQVGPNLTGHTGDVFGLAFSPDGSRLASVSADRTVRLWDALAGVPIGVPMAGSPVEVTWAAFAPDGQYLAVASADGSVRFYDTITQAPIGVPLQALDGFPQGLAIDSAGRNLIIAGSDGTVRIYDLGMVLPRPGVALAFSPDGSKMVTGDKDGALRMWRGDEVAPKVFDARMGEVHRLAFLPDGRQLLAADALGDLQLWDSDSATKVGTPMSVPGNGVLSVAPSSDADQVLAGYADGTVRLWDIKAGKELRAPFVASGGITTVGWLDGGKHVAAFSVDGDTGKLWVWDRETGEEQAKRDLGPTYALAFGPDGAIAGGALDGTVAMMTGIGGEVIGTPVSGHSDGIVAVNYSSDGRRVASAARDGSVRLWDTDSGAPIGQPIRAAPESVGYLAFRPDGQLLATGSGSGASRLWPAAASAADLCAKLAANMSRKHWSESVSPNIDYVTACPDLPVAPD